MADPVRHFEHSHAALSTLAFEVRALLAADAEHSEDIAVHARLTERLQRLRDALLQHFAGEEEGLFPFVRAHLPSRAAVVDQLATAHEAICKAIIHLVQLAEKDRAGAPLAREYDAFETAYAEHSQAESVLFGELGELLKDEDRTALAALLARL